jgi:hypothetical protein
MTCFVVFAQGIALSADKTTEPYEAIVDQDDTPVWSGPNSEKHYPTCRLNKGDRVTVVLSDFGGWCRIEPPKGSFSWVRADDVELQSQNSGTIKSKRAKVYVGSEVHPEKTQSFHVELSKNEPIEVLGVKEFDVNNTRVRMLKISPVAKQEWRWIRRKSIVAADAIKPFPSELPIPKQTSEPATDNEWDAVQLPESLGTLKRELKPVTEVSEAKVKVAEKAAEKEQPQQVGKQRLSEIDHEFRDMIKSDCESWNLDTVEDQYIQLNEDVGTAWMTGQITGRLDAVKRYRKTYNEYMAFLKLTSETKQRDAQLSALQARYQPQMLGNGARTPTPIDADATKTASTTPSAPTTPSTPTPSESGTTPKFDGAGIVKKLAQSFPGGPTYVLISPEGKALTFLQPTPGVDLDRYDGKAMGIIGSRARREDWSSDVITVRSLQPVQLRTAAK